MQLVDRTKTDLGICLIDVYRAPGDLYSSWDIVQANPDGSFSRVPDARYGPDAPNYELSVGDFTPVHLVEIHEHWDRNGWSERSTRIETIKGEVIASRGN